jgi:hypothetical protein
MKYFFIALTTMTICGTAIYFAENNKTNINTEEVRARMQVPVEAKVQKDIDWNLVDEKIRIGIQAAHENAIAYGQELLVAWHNDKMEKIDSNFLEWYFGYFTQLEIGAKAVGYAATNWWNNSTRSASDQVATEVLKELEHRVFPTLLMNGEMESIAKETVSIFINSLGKELQDIPQSYKIPQEDWNRHLEEIAVMVSDIEGLRSQPLTLKALSAGALIGTKTLALPLTKIVVPAIKATVGRSIKSFSLKTATNVATKRAIAAGTTKGSAMAASGPFAVFVFGGLLAWEAWDHHSTVAANKPLMREQLKASLDQLEKNLIAVDGPIGAPLYDIEKQIHKSLL